MSEKNHRRGIRFTALVVAFIFTMTSVTWSTPASAAPADAAVPVFSPIDRLAIPAEMGTITKEYGVRSKGYGEILKPGTPYAVPRTVILIQDAHAVVDAQENISKILGHLRKNYGISLTALEGAKGRLEPILLRTFPEPNVKRKILAGYESRAELSGPEMAAVLQEEASDFRGMEDWGLYEQNYAAYLRAQEKKSALISRWNTFKRTLDSSRAKIYDPKLTEFQEARENFLAERSSLLDLLVYLSEFKGLLAARHPKAGKAEGSQSEIPRSTQNDEATAADYQELPGLISSIGYEKTGGQEALIPMVRKIADEFKTKYLRGLGVKTEMNFYNRYQAFMTGQLTAGQMLQYLVQLGRENGKNVKLTPALKKLLGHAELLSEIKGSRLYDELQRFLPEVEASLIKTPAQREIAEKYQRLYLLKDLITLELTHEQLSECQVIFPGADLFPLSQRGNKGDLASVRPIATTNLPLPLFTKEGDRLMNDPAFNQDLAPALEFYQAALARDHAFLQKIDAMMKDAKQKNVVVVAGGFHTNGLERILQEQGVAYAVVTPKIASLAGIDNYAKVMKGEVSFKAYLKTTYFDALMRHAAKALTEALPIPERVRTLKQWRDNVIRELAKEGRITDAGKYLPYIDEILQSTPEMATAIGPKRTKDEILGIVRKELEKFKNDSLERIWKTFEFQLGIFTDGLKQLVAKKDLNTQTVSALLDRASNSKPALLAPCAAMGLFPEVGIINAIWSNISPDISGITGKMVTADQILNKIKENEKSPLSSFEEKALIESTAADLLKHGSQVADFMRESQREVGKVPDSTLDEPVRNMLDELASITNQSRKVVAAQLARAMAAKMDAEGIAAPTAISGSTAETPAGEPAPIRPPAGELTPSAEATTQPNSVGADRIARSENRGQGQELRAEKRADTTPPDGIVEIGPNGVVGAAHEGSAVFNIMKERFEKILGRFGGKDDPAAWDKVFDALAMKDGDLDKITEALQKLLPVGITPEQIKGITGRILLVNVGERNLVREGGRLGGLIVRHNGELKILLPRERLNEGGQEFLGDLLHELVEVELFEMGMSIEEAHLRALKVQKIFLESDQGAKARDELFRIRNRQLSRLKELVGIEAVARRDKDVAASEAAQEIMDEVKKRMAPLPGVSEGVRRRLMSAEVVVSRHAAMSGMVFFMNDAHPEKVTVILGENAWRGCSQAQKVFILGHELGHVFAMELKQIEENVGELDLPDVSRIELKKNIGGTVEDVADMMGVWVAGQLIPGLDRGDIIGIFGRLRELREALGIRGEEKAEGGINREGVLIEVHRPENGRDDFLRMLPPDPEEILAAVQSIMAPWTERYGKIAGGARFGWVDVDQKTLDRGIRHALGLPEQPPNEILGAAHGERTVGEYSKDEPSPEGPGDQGPGDQGSGGPSGPGQKPPGGPANDGLGSAPPGNPPGNPHQAVPLNDRGSKHFPPTQVGDQSLRRTYRAVGPEGQELPAGYERRQRDKSRAPETAAPSIHNEQSRTTPAVTEALAVKRAEARLSEGEIKEIQTKVEKSLIDFQTAILKYSPEDATPARRQAFAVKKFAYLGIRDAGSGEEREQRFEGNIRPGDVLLAHPKDMSDGWVLVVLGFESDGRAQFLKMTAGERGWQFLPDEQKENLSALIVKDVYRPFLRADLSATPAFKTSPAGFFRKLFGGRSELRGGLAGSVAAAALTLAAGITMAVTSPAAQSEPSAAPAPASAAGIVSTNAVVIEAAQEKKILEAMAEAEKVKDSESTKVLGAELHKLYYTLGGKLQDKSNTSTAYVEGFRLFDYMLSHYERIRKAEQSEVPVSDVLTPEAVSTTVNLFKNPSSPIRVLLPEIRENGRAADLSTEQEIIDALLHGDGFGFRAVTDTTSGRIRYEKAALKALNALAIRAAGGDVKAQKALVALTEQLAFVSAHEQIHKIISGDPAGLDRVRGILLEEGSPDRALLVEVVKALLMNPVYSDKFEQAGVVFVDLSDRNAAAEEVLANSSAAQEAVGEFLAGQFLYNVPETTLSQYEGRRKALLGKLSGNASRYGLPITYIKKMEIRRTIAEAIGASAETSATPDAYKGSGPVAQPSKPAETQDLTSGAKSGKSSTATPAETTRSEQRGKLASAAAAAAAAGAILLAVANPALAAGQTAAELAPSRVSTSQQISQGADFQFDRLWEAIQGQGVLAGVRPEALRSSIEFSRRPETLALVKQAYDLLIQKGLLQEGTFFPVLFLTGISKDHLEKIGATPDSFAIAPKGSGVVIVAREALESISKEGDSRPVWITVKAGHEAQHHVDFEKDTKMPVLASEANAYAVTAASMELAGYPAEQVVLQKKVAAAFRILADNPGAIKEAFGGISDDDFRAVNYGNIGVDESDFVRVELTSGETARMFGVDLKAQAGKQIFELQEIKAPATGTKGRTSAIRGTNESLGGLMTPFGSLPGVMGLALLGLMTAAPRRNARSEARGEVSADVDAIAPAAETRRSESLAGERIARAETRASKIGTDSASKVSDAIVRETLGVSTDYLAGFLGDVGQSLGLSEDQYGIINAEKKWGMVIAYYELGRDPEDNLAGVRYQSVDEAAHKAAVLARIARHYKGGLFQEDPSILKEAEKIVQNGTVYPTYSPVTGKKYVVVVPDRDAAQEARLTTKNDAVTGEPVSQTQGGAYLGAILINPDSMESYGGRNREFTSLEAHEAAHLDIGSMANFRSFTEGRWVSEFYAQLCDFAVIHSEALGTQQPIMWVAWIFQKLLSEQYVAKYGKLSREQFADLDSLITVLCELLMNSLKAGISKEDVLDQVREYLASQTSIHEAAVQANAMLNRGTKGQVRHRTIDEIVRDAESLRARVKATIAEKGMSAPKVVNIFPSGERLDHAPKTIEDFVRFFEETGGNDKTFAFGGFKLPTPEELAERYPAVSRLRPVYTIKFSDLFPAAEMPSDLWGIFSENKKLLVAAKGRSENRDQGQGQGTRDQGQERRSELLAGERIAAVGSTASPSSPERSRRAETRSESRMTDDEAKILKELDAVLKMAADDPARNETLEQLRIGMRRMDTVPESDAFFEGIFTRIGPFIAREDLIGQAQHDAIKRVLHNVLSRSEKSKAIDNASIVLEHLIRFCKEHKRGWDENRFTVFAMTDFISKVMEANWSTSVVTPEIPSQERRAFLLNILEEIKQSNLDSETGLLLGHILLSQAVEDPATWNAIYSQLWDAYGGYAQNELIRMADTERPEDKAAIHSAFQKVAFFTLFARQGLLAGLPMAREHYVNCYHRIAEMVSDSKASNFEVSVAENSLRYNLEEAKKIVTNLDVAIGIFAHELGHGLDFLDNASEEFVADIFSMAFIEALGLDESSFISQTGYREAHAKVQSNPLEVEEHAVARNRLVRYGQKFQEAMERQGRTNFLPWREFAFIITKVVLARSDLGVEKRHYTASINGRRFTRPMAFSTLIREFERALPFLESISAALPARADISQQNPNRQRVVIPEAKFVPFYPSHDKGAMFADPLYKIPKPKRGIEEMEGLKKMIFSRADFLKPTRTVSGTGPASVQPTPTVSDASRRETPSTPSGRSESRMAGLYGYLMKKVLMPAVFALFLIAPSARAGGFFSDLASHVSMGPTVSYMAYEEPGYMTEKGFLYGIQGAYEDHWNDVMLSLEAEYSRGQVEYTGLEDGYTQNNTDNLFSVSGRVGYRLPFLESLSITPYTGLGYRRLEDDLGIPAGDAFDVTRRISNYEFLRLGMEVERNWRDGKFVVGTLEYDYFLKGWQENISNIGYDDAVQHQKEGYGIRASLEVGNRTFSFFVDARVWRIGSSDTYILRAEENGGETARLVSAYALVEPENFNTEVRVGLKVAFGSGPRSELREMLPHQSPELAAKTKRSEVRMETEEERDRAVSAIADLIPGGERDLTARRQERAVARTWAGRIFQRVVLLALLLNTFFAGLASAFEITPRVTYDSSRDDLFTGIELRFNLPGEPVTRPRTRSESELEPTTLTGWQRLGLAGAVVAANLAMARHEDSPKMRGVMAYDVMGSGLIALFAAFRHKEQNWFDNFLLGMTAGTIKHASDLGMADTIEKPGVGSGLFSFSRAVGTSMEDSIQRGAGVLSRYEYMFGPAVWRWDEKTGYSQFFQITPLAVMSDANSMGGELSVRDTLKIGAPVFIIPDRPNSDFVGYSAGGIVMMTSSSEYRYERFQGGWFAVLFHERGHVSQWQDASRLTYLFAGRDLEIFEKYGWYPYSDLAGLAFYGLQGATGDKKKPHDSQMAELVPEAWESYVGNRIEPNFGKIERREEGEVFLLQNGIREVLYNGASILAPNGNYEGIERKDGGFTVKLTEDGQIVLLDCSKEGENWIMEKGLDRLEITPGSDGQPVYILNGETLQMQEKTAEGAPRSEMREGQPKPESVRDLMVRIKATEEKGDQSTAERLTARIVDSVDRKLQRGERENARIFMEEYVLKTSLKTRVALFDRIWKASHALELSVPFFSESERDGLWGIFRNYISFGGEATMAGGVHPFYPDRFYSAIMNPAKDTGYAMESLMPLSLLALLTNELQSHQLKEGMAQEYDPVSNKIGIDEYPIVFPHEAGHWLFMKKFAEWSGEKNANGMPADIQKFWNGNMGQADRMPRLEDADLPGLVQEYRRLVGARSPQMLDSSGAFTRRMSLNENFAFNLERLTYGAPFVVANGSQTGTKDILEFFVKTGVIQQWEADHYLELSRRMNQGKDVDPIHVSEAGWSDHTGSYHLEPAFAKQAAVINKILPIEKQLGRPLLVSEEIAVLLGDYYVKRAEDVDQWLSTKESREKLRDFILELGYLTKEFEARAFPDLKPQVLSRNDEWGYEEGGVEDESGPQNETGSSGVSPAIPAEVEKPVAAQVFSFGNSSSGLQLQCSVFKDDRIQIEMLMGSEPTGDRWNFTAQQGQEAITIGRADDSKVRLNSFFSNFGVSRQHAEILFNDGQWQLTDISSKGTYLNGEKLSGPAVIGGSRSEVREGTWGFKGMALARTMAFMVFVEALLAFGTWMAYEAYGRLRAQPAKIERVQAVAAGDDSSRRVSLLNELVRGQHESWAMKRQEIADAYGRMSEGQRYKIRLALFGKRQAEALGRAGDETQRRALSGTMMKDLREGICRVVNGKVAAKNWINASIFRNTAEKYDISEEELLGLILMEASPDLNPNAKRKNKNGTTDYGLCQVNETTLRTHVKDKMTQAEKDAYLIPSANIDIAAKDYAAKKRNVTETVNKLHLKYGLKSPSEEEMVKYSGVTYNVGSGKATEVLNERLNRRNAQYAKIFFTDYGTNYFSGVNLLQLMVEIERMADDSLPQLRAAEARPAAGKMPTRNTKASETEGGLDLLSIGLLLSATVVGLYALKRMAEVQAPRIESERAEHLTEELGVGKIIWKSQDTDYIPPLIETEEGYHLFLHDIDGVDKRGRPEPAKIGHTLNITYEPDSDNPLTLVAEKLPIEIHGEAKGNFKAWNDLYAYYQLIPASATALDIRRGKIARSESRDGEKDPGQAGIRSEMPATMKVVKSPVDVESVLQEFKSGWSGISEAEQDILEKMLRDMEFYQTEKTAKDFNLYKTASYAVLKDLFSKRPGAAEGEPVSRILYIVKSLQTPAFSLGATPKIRYHISLEPMNRGTHRVVDRVDVVANDRSQQEAVTFTASRTLIESAEELDRTRQEWNTLRGLQADIRDYFQAPLDLSIDEVRKTAVVYKTFIPGYNLEEWVRSKKGQAGVLADLFEKYGALLGDIYKKTDGQLPVDAMLKNIVTDLSGNNVWEPLRDIDMEGGFVKASGSLEIFCLGNPLVELAREITAEGQGDSEEFRAIAVDYLAAYFSARDGRSAEDRVKVREALRRSFAEEPPALELFFEKGLQVYESVFGIQNAEEQMRKIFAESTRSEVRDGVLDVGALLEDENGGLHMVLLDLVNGKAKIVDRVPTMVGDVIEIKSAHAGVLPAGRTELVYFETDLCTFDVGRNTGSPDISFAHSDFWNLENVKNLIMNLDPEKGGWVLLGGGTNYQNATNRIDEIEKGRELARKMAAERNVRLITAFPKSPGIRLTAVLDPVHGTVFLSPQRSEMRATTPTADAGKRTSALKQRLNTLVRQLEDIIQRRAEGSFDDAVGPSLISGAAATDHEAERVIGLIEGFLKQNQEQIKKNSRELYGVDSDLDDPKVYPWGFYPTRVSTDNFAKAVSESIAAHAADFVKIGDVRVLEVGPSSGRGTLAALNRFQKVPGIHNLEFDLVDINPDAIKLTTANLKKFFDAQDIAYDFDEKTSTFAFKNGDLNGVVRLYNQDFTIWKKRGTYHLVYFDSPVAMPDEYKSSDNDFAVSLPNRVYEGILRGVFGRLAPDGRFLLAGYRHGERNIRKILPEASLVVPKVTREETEEKMRGDEARIVLDITRSETRTEIGKYYVLNKPVGVISTEKPEGNAPDTPIALDLIDDVGAREGKHLVGRLDKETSGILLVGGNNELNQMLLDPTLELPGKVQKTYEVVVGGRVSAEILGKLRDGFKISDNGKEYFVKADRAKILEEYYDGRRPMTRLEIVISEGKYHQIRKMMSGVNRTVNQLTRIAFGPVQLGTFPEGQRWRELTPEEYVWLTDFYDTNLAAYREKINTAAAAKKAPAAAPAESTKRSEARVGQNDLAGMIKAAKAADSKFVKEPILGFLIDGLGVPAGIKGRLGKVDATYVSVEKVLEANVGGFIALQVKGNKPDLYVVSPTVAEGKYSKGLIGYDGYKNLIRAMKNGEVQMFRMSDIGFPVNEPATIEVDWGTPEKPAPDTQTKPAGKDAFLAFDGKQWYMLNVNNEGLPINYVPVSEKGEGSSDLDRAIQKLIDDIAQKGQLSTEERNKVEMIFALAKQAHSDQKRKNGDRYFRHPVEMAQYALDRFGVQDTVAQRVYPLHDTREDQAEFYDVIRSILDDMFEKLERLGVAAATTTKKNEEDIKDYNQIRLGVKLLSNIELVEINREGRPSLWQITHKDKNGNDITRSFESEAEAEAAADVQYYKQILNPHQYFKKKSLTGVARYAAYDDAFVRRIQQGKISDRIVNIRDLINLFNGKVELTPKITGFPERMIGKTLKWFIPLFIEGEDGGKRIDPADRKIFYEDFLNDLVRYAELTDPRAVSLRDAAIKALNDPIMKTGIEVAGMREQVGRVLAPSRSEARTDVAANRRRVVELVRTGKGDMKDVVGVHGTSLEAILALIRDGRLPNAARTPGKFYFYPVEKDFDAVEEAQAYTDANAPFHYVLTRLKPKTPFTNAEIEKIFQYVGEYKLASNKPKEYASLWRKIDKADLDRIVIESGRVGVKGVLLYISRQKIDADGIAVQLEKNDGGANERFIPLKGALKQGLPLDFIIGIEPVGRYERNELEKIAAVVGSLDAAKAAPSATSAGRAEMRVVIGGLAQVNAPQIIDRVQAGDVEKVGLELRGEAEARLKELEKIVGERALVLENELQNKTAEELAVYLNSDGFEKFMRENFGELGDTAPVVARIRAFLSAAKPGALVGIEGFVDTGRTIDHEYLAPKFAELNAMNDALSAKAKEHGLGVVTNHSGQDSAVILNMLGLLTLDRLIVLHRKDQPLGSSWRIAPLTNLVYDMDNPNRTAEKQAQKALVSNDGNTVALWTDDLKVGNMGIYTIMAEIGRLSDPELKALAAAAIRHIFLKYAAASAEERQAMSHDWILADLNKMGFGSVIRFAKGTNTLVFDMQGLADMFTAREAIETAA